MQGCDRQESKKSPDYLQYIFRLQDIISPLCSDGLCSGLQWTPASSGLGREREEERDTENRRDGNPWLMKSSRGCNDDLRRLLMMEMLTLDCGHSVHFVYENLQHEPLNTCRVRWCTVYSLTVTVHMYSFVLCASVCHTSAAEFLLTYLTGVPENQ